MAKKEAQTDIWVYDLLKSAHITLEYQGSTIAEIEKALKTAYMLIVYLKGSRPISIRKEVQL